MLKSKKGLSGVLETVIMVAVTFAVVSIIWVVVNGLVNEKTKSAESCFGIYDKVSLDQRYTCYNNTLSQDEVWFSINVGEIEKIDDIHVAISGGGSTIANFKIIEDQPAALRYYNRTQPVTIPKKNQGQVYIYTLPGGSPTPESIIIAVIIEGEMCSEVDSIEQFDSCAAIV